VLKSRFWIISGLTSAALIATLLQPAVASAATHSGSWDFPPGATKATPSYGTHNTAKTCVKDTKLNSNNRWKFELVWYDGGNNVRLYVSPIFGSRATHCSPTETMPRTNDKVYDIITALPNAGSSPYAGGTYTITTN
jgi:hypothetical protein